MPVFNIPLSVRFSQEHYRQIKALAEKHGINQQQAVRACVFHGADTADDVLTRIAKINRQVRRISPKARP